METKITFVTDSVLFAILIYSFISNSNVPRDLEQTLLRRRTKPAKNLVPASCVFDSREKRYGHNQQHKRGSKFYVVQHTKSLNL